MDTTQDVPQPARDAREPTADGSPRSRRLRDPDVVLDAEGVAALGRLADVLGGLVDALTGEPRPQLTPEEFIALAVRCFPFGRHVAVSEAGAGGRLDVLASVDDFSARAAAIEAAGGEGPVHDVLTDTEVIVSNDLAAEARWPWYGPKAVELLGLRSVAAYRIRRPGRSPAALVFLSDWPDAFDELAVIMGSLLALHCSLAALGRGEVGEVGEPVRPPPPEARDDADRRRPGGVTRSALISCPGGCRA